MSQPHGNYPPELTSLQAFIRENTLPRGSLHPPDNHRLALQVVHNLRFQHDWSELDLHYDLRSSSAGGSAQRPLISGLPPKRLYVHPDEQIELLQRQRDAGKAGWPELTKEREWVLPSQLTEQWSLRKFDETFRNLPTIPPEYKSPRKAPEGGKLLWVAQAKGQDGGGSGTETPQSDGVGSTSTLSKEQQAANAWRMKLPKRILLGTLNDDSTIVYYVVHDGLSKPRQN